MGSEEWEAPLAEVESGSGSGVLAFPIKLTDSSLKALVTSLESGAEASLEVGEGGTGRLTLAGAPFHFALKSLGLGDGCLHLLRRKDPASFRFLHQPTHRIQVSGTEDSFSSARARTKQLVEEEQRRAGKEVRHRNAVRPSARLPAALAHVSSTAASAKPSTRPSTGPPKPAFDFSKKSLRDRVLHLLATKTYTKDQLMDKLRWQDAGIVERGDVTKLLHDLATARDLLDEKTGQSMQSFSLRSELFKDCDPKWPGFTSFDRQLVLKKQGSSRATSSMPSLTVREKPPSGRSRETAGRGNPSPEPGSKRKTSPGADDPPSVSPPLSIPDDPPQEKVRVAHAKGSGPLQPFVPAQPPAQPPAAQPSSQPPAQPREPSQAPAKTAPPKATPKAVGGAGAEASGGPAKRARPSPPSEPELPAGPEKAAPLDLEELRAEFQAEFPRIADTGPRGLAERRSYHQKFNSDYAEYWRCYERLSKVAALFDTLERKLRAAEDAAALDVETEIERYYRQYITDPKFLRRQRQHQRLRQKLAVLKARIQDFDARYAQHSAPKASATANGPVPKAASPQPS